MTETIYPLGIIYQIRNKINGKFYAGSTIGFSQRRKAHLDMLKKKKHHSDILQRAWNKYGEDSFEFIILEEHPNINIRVLHSDYEQPWINKAHYNVAPFAGGGPQSIETRAKMSRSQRGRKHSPETKQKISDAHTGKKHTKQHRHNLSKSRVGFCHSIETKKRISNTQKGVKIKPYTPIKCPHCSISGRPCNMYRWHFDNCKKLRSSSRFGNQSFDSPP